MPEREPVHPDIAAALRAYEIEIRDGNERSQQEAFRKLKETQRRLGGAAVTITQQIDRPAQNRAEPDEQQLAST